MQKQKTKNINDLAEERGRHENIPRNDRFCKYCILKMVEKEYILWWFALFLEIVGENT